MRCAECKKPITKTEVQNSVTVRDPVTNKPTAVYHRKCHNKAVERQSGKFLADRPTAYSVERMYASKDELEAGKVPDNTIVADAQAQREDQLEALRERQIDIAEQRALEEVPHDDSNWRGSADAEL